MKTKGIVSLLVLTILPIALLAQNNKIMAADKSNRDQSYFLADISYISDAVFMGRRDSISAPYIFPSMGYYDATGFFGQASASYLTRSEEGRIDLFLISTGYTFDSEKWSGGISGTAYFFNGNSYNVRSETIGDITGILGYDLKTFEITLTASSYFNTSSSPDYFTGLEIDRVFYAVDNDLLIDPTMSVHMGSQYFYQEYYATSRLGNRKGKGLGTMASDSNPATNLELVEASQFKLLNFEISIPIQYYYDRFIFSFTPAWAFPQGNATFTTDDAVYEEDLTNVFYWSAGISYWFLTNKGK